MQTKRKWMCSILLVCVMVSSAAAVSEQLIPLGIPAGVRMTAEGAVISAMTEVDSPAGKICPGKLAGLACGDIVQTVNDIPVSSGGQLAQIVQDSEGKPVQISGLRGKTAIAVTVQPVKSTVTATYQIGILVRDSMAGIGTLTYADPETKQFGALGHPISDVDSGALLPLDSGSAVPANVVRVVAGQSGKPGELIGAYDFSREIGTLKNNTSCGVFGQLTEECLYEQKQAIDVAASSDIQAGDAEILTCVQGDTPKKYDILIERTDARADNGRNMKIRVTDADLLQKTGGIVPGMSGSPIIQDGKLVGAVTHVLVNDPTRGYGIFIENMLEAAK